MPDVLSSRQTEPEEDPARFTRKRLVRWVTVLTVGTVLMWACWQDPLYL